jgi:hypothetical protein
MKEPYKWLQAANVAAAIEAIVISLIGLRRQMTLSKLVILPSTPDKIKLNQP